MGNLRVRTDIMAQFDRSEVTDRAQIQTHLPSRVIALTGPAGEGAGGGKRHRR